MKDEIKLFEKRQVRSVWDEEQEKWWFSVVDVVGILSESENPQVYWRVLKKRLTDEGNETVTNCNGLKMLSPDGKMRLTDVALNKFCVLFSQSLRLKPSRLNDGWRRSAGKAPKSLIQEQPLPAMPVWK
jgi:hypothetical protein